MKDPRTLPLTMTNIALALVPLSGLATALFGILYEVVARARSSPAKTAKPEWRLAAFL